MATAPIKHISRLHKGLIAAGVLVESLNSAGVVSPVDLQKSAQPIIDAFDDSEEAENKALINDASAKAKALLADPKSEFYHLNLAWGATLTDEIKVAVPAYVPPTTDQLKQSVDTKIDEVKPAGIEVVGAVDISKEGG